MAKQRTNTKIGDYFDNWSFLDLKDFIETIYWKNFREIKERFSTRRVESSDCVNLLFWVKNWLCTRWYIFSQYFWRNCYPKLTKGSLVFFTVFIYDITAHLRWLVCSKLYFSEIHGHSHWSKKICKNTMEYISKLIGLFLSKAVGTVHRSYTERNIFKFTLNCFTIFNNANL